MVKSGLYIVLTIAEHGCDVLERVLYLSEMQTYLVKNEYLLSLQLYGDQAIYTWTALKACLQIFSCDPYELRGDQA